MSTVITWHELGNILFFRFVPASMKRENNNTMEVVEHIPHKGHTDYTSLYPQ